MTDISTIFNLPIVTGRGGGLGLHENGTFASSGGTPATYRHRHTIVSTAGTVSALQLVYANQVGEGQPGNSIDVEASLVIRGMILPVPFAGNRTKTLLPNQIGKSDLVPVPALKPGDSFNVVSGVTVASGGTYPCGNPTVAVYGDENQGADGTLNGDGVVVGTNAVLTNTGMNPGDAYAFSPVAVLGISTTAMPGVMLYGDSIQSGQGDTQHEFGFGVRACNTAGVGWARISLAGETAGSFARLVNHARRARFFAGIPTALSNYGINDVWTGSSVADTKAALIGAWGVAKRGGVSKNYQTTLTPGEFTDARETVRTAINTWLRSGQAQAENPALLDGVFDVAATVESATDGGSVQVGGGYWAAGTKLNFLHPNQSGHTAMATAIPVAALVAARVSVPSASARRSASLNIGF